MTKEEYLITHHEITQRLIGLVSIQKDIEGVQKVLSVWKPKLNQAFKERMETLCAEDGTDSEDMKAFLRFD